MHLSFSMPRPAVVWLLALVLAAGLAGCASAPNKAPIEDRKPRRPTTSVPAVAPASSAVESTGAAVDTLKLLPGAENAGKPGYYSVKPGDTLIRIGLDNGQNWRDVARWNNIDKPNLIEVGQVLRVVPPGLDPAAVASRGVAPTKVESRPLDGKPAAAGVAAGSAVAAVSTPTASAPLPALAAAAPTAAKADADDEPTWAWPASGAVVTGFEEGRQKGSDREDQLVDDALERERPAQMLGIGSGYGPVFAYASTSVVSAERSARKATVCEASKFAIDEVICDHL